MPTRVQRVLAETRGCFEENKAGVWADTRHLQAPGKHGGCAPHSHAHPGLVHFLQETATCLAVFNGHVQDKLYCPYRPLVLSEPLSNHMHIAPILKEQVGLCASQ